MLGHKERTKANQLKLFQRGTSSCVKSVGYKWSVYMCKTSSISTNNPFCPSAALALALQPFSGNSSWAMSGIPWAKLSDSSYLQFASQVGSDEL